MKRFSALVKLNLKYYVLPSFEGKKSKARFVGVIALMCVAFLAPLVLICMTLWFAAQTMLAMGMGAEMLAAVFTMAQIMVLMLSAFTYINSMFFAKDNEIVLNMPLRGVEIFSAKLIATYLNELVISALVTIPIAVITAAAGIQAGYGSMFGAGYWILIPFAIALLPVMPLLLLSIVSFPIALLVQKASKYPVLSAVLQAVLLMAFISLCYLLGYGGGYAMSSDETQVDTGMFQSLGGISFYTRFLAKAMLGSSAAGNFFAFLGITVAMAAVAIGLSVLLYRRAIAMSVEGGANTKRKVKTDEHVNKGTFRALVAAQVKTLSRTPDILVNLILTMAMPALIAVIMGFVMPSGAEIAAEDPDAAMPYFGYFAVGLVVWITMFTSPLSNIGASFAFSLDKDNIAVLKSLPVTGRFAFSLDKDNIAVLKSLPVTGREVFKSKLIVSDAVSLISVVAVAVVLAFTADIPFWGYVLFPLLVGVYLISCNAFTMSRDVANPHFNWMNVKELTKASNSATQFIMMGVGLAFGLVAAMPMFVIAFIGANLPGWAVHLIVWGAMALSCLSAYPVLRLTALKGIEEKYARIEG